MYSYICYYDVLSTPFPGNLNVLKRVNDVSAVLICILC